MCIFVCRYNLPGTFFRTKLVPSQSCRYKRLAKKRPFCNKNFTHLIKICLKASFSRLKIFTLSMQVRGWKQNKNKRAESDRSCFVMAKTYNFHSSIWASIQREWKSRKTRFTKPGKSLTEFKFYNSLDPGTKDKKKPIYNLRKVVLNQALNYTVN